MKQLFLSLSLLFIALVGWQCSTPRIPEGPATVDIDLSTLDSRYLSLKPYTNRIVIIGGQYKGDRIVLRDVAQVKILFAAGTQINSTHAEDALVFDGPVRNAYIDARNLSIEGGGITFWSSLFDVELIGGRIHNAHTGIRATAPKTSRNVVIRGWRISNTSHEGIYIGPSKASENKLTNISILDNYISDTDWDGIQGGNTTQLIIADNTIIKAGITKTYGQDYGITVNPGCVAYVYGNEVLETDKPLQCLDSRVFWHAP